MISNLTTAICPHDRDISRSQHMFGFAGLAESKHRPVLKPPQLVSSVCLPPLSKLAHGSPGAGIILQSGSQALSYNELPYDELSYNELPSNKLSSRDYGLEL
jgi:hypothetical protein